MLATRDELEAKAAEIGMKVDGRWSDDKLAERLESYSGPDKEPSAAPAKQVRVRVLRDFWIGEERHHKGHLQFIPIEEALQRVEDGVVETWNDAKAEAARHAEEAKQDRRAR